MTAGIIFDLDGTLYDTTGIDTENRLAALRAISDHTKVPIEKADELLKATQQSTGTASISKSVFRLGVSDSTFARHQLEMLHPEKYVDADPLLVKLIHQARANHKTALYTNTRRELVTRILKCIGLSDQDFDLIVAGGDTEEPKPSVGELQKVVDRLGVSPTNCFVVGDRWAVDLEPAAALGMTPIHIHSRDALIEWLQSIL